MSLLTYIEKIDWEKILSTIGLIALQIIGLLLCYMIVKKIGFKIIDRTFERVKTRGSITHARAITLQKLVENVLSYTLIFLIVASIFSVLGLPIASLIAGAGIAGLAIGFGAQGLVSDVVTGFFLLLERQIDVNDYVTIGEIDGVVEAVGLRTTQIRDFDGTLHYLPNRDIQCVSNHSRGNMRALVDIEIPHHENIDKTITVIEQVCRQIASENKTIVEGPQVLGVQAIGSENTVLRIIAKTENGEQWAAERQIRKEVKEAFEQHEIDTRLTKKVVFAEKA